MFRLWCPGLLWQAVQKARTRDTRGRLPIGLCHHQATTQRPGPEDLSDLEGAHIRSISEKIKMIVYSKKGSGFDSQRTLPESILQQYSCPHYLLNDITLLITALAKYWWYLPSLVFRKLHGQTGAFPKKRPITDAPGLVSTHRESA